MQTVPQLYLQVEEASRKTYTTYIRTREREEKLPNVWEPEAKDA